MKNKLATKKRVKKTSKPAERWVSQSEFARLMNMSPSAIYNAVKKGRIKSKKKGRQVLIEYNSQRIAFLQTAPTDLRAVKRARAKREKLEKRTGKLEGGSGEDAAGLPGMYETKLAYERAKTKKMELDLAEAEGKLIDAGKMERLLLSVAVNLQKSILAVPSRIGPLAAAEHDATKCTILIGRELRRCLQAVSGSFGASGILSDPGSVRVPDAK